MGREIMQIHTTLELKEEFKNETKSRCMNMSKVINLFMERFINSPKEAIEFLFNE